MGEGEVLWAFSFPDRVGNKLSPIEVTSMEQEL